MKGSLQKLQDVLVPPFYMFVRGTTSIICDKMVPADKRLSRTRYFINGNQCTCLGWIKTRSCKHLHMLADSYDFIGSNGISESQALTEVERIKSAFEDQFSNPGWDVNEMGLTDNNIALYFRVPLDNTKNILKVVSIKSFPKDRKAAIVFVVNKL